MALRSRSVLPYLLPQLLAPPMSSFNARALAALAEVAGASLNTHISTILPALVNAMQSDDEGLSFGSLPGVCGWHSPMDTRTRSCIPPPFFFPLPTHARA